MPLAAGTRLGPYEIQSALGAGGMGEVYQARDTRLGRTVAIKVMPPDVAADPQFRTRFDREARAISQLQHAHICTLYDVGEMDGTAFLVMELLQGQTLAKRLEKGAVPLEESLRIATDVADALSAAHRQGFVHRDLKPANVMLTKTGAKLLDFGLAKATAPVVSVGAAPTHETASTHLTGSGAILGTLHYMSPEQVEGLDADARSDIWAFGTVLYEMVTGTRPFAGDTPASVVSSILKDTPVPLTSHQPVAPVALDRLVSACLAKDPEDRWQDAGDLTRELHWLRAGNSDTARSGDVATRRFKRAAWFAAGIAFGVTALGMALWLRMPQTSAGAPRRVLALAPPDGIRVTGSTALSPDSRSFVFVGQGAQGPPSLWIRSIDTGESRQLPNTEDPSYPFWSPNGDAVGFFADGKLKTLSLNGGGPPRVLASATSSRGGSWGLDGAILFVPETNSPILQVPAAGGEPRAITTLDVSRGEIGHRWPAAVDSDHFLFTIQSTRPDVTGIYLGSLSSPTISRLTSQYSNSTYVGGWLLHVNGGAIVARALDVGKATVDRPIEVTGPVALASGLGYAVFSATGDLLTYAPGNGEAPTTVIEWFDRTGRPLGRVGNDSDLGNYNAYYQQLSPDGHRVVMSAFASTTADLWVVDLNRGVPFQFTFDAATEMNPTWAPNGSELMYASNRGGFYNIYQQSVSSPGRERRVTESPSHQYPTDWSRDGGTIIFTNLDAKTQSDVWAMKANGEEAGAILSDRFNEYAARLSPDGRWLAYTSDESERAEVFLRRFPAMDNKTKVSTQGGVHPVWRADGSELFYLGSDRKVYVVPMTAGVPGSAKKVFDVSVDTSLGSMHADHVAVSADGQQFLVNISTMNETALAAVENWRRALERR